MKRNERAARGDHQEGVSLRATELFPQPRPSRKTTHDLPPRRGGKEAVRTRYVSVRREKRSAQSAREREGERARGWRGGEC